jgi:choline dehydrogenase-like flavoprotein
VLRDFRELGDNDSIQADLCIIGAGAAGIAIAREFIGTSTQVCVIESGDLAIDPDTQALYAGENVGWPYSLVGSRLRFFGGTTNHWRGHCWPLSEIDFRERSWIPHSGWPIERAALDSAYERAHALCELGPFIYDDRLWKHVPAAAPAFRSSHIATRFWQQPPPTLFGVRYREELEQADNIVVLFNANVTTIETNESASAVTHVELRTLEGKLGSVQASRFVLACGGIENARVLLLSNHNQPAGLGNQRDLVGRFFMDHSHVPCATARVEYGSAIQRVFCTASHIPDPDGKKEPTPFFPAIGASQALQEREQILNTSFRVYGNLDPESGISEAGKLARSLKRHELPDDLGSLLWNITRDINNVVRAASGGEQRGAQLLQFYARSESAPNPDSRVTLSDDVDALGLRRTRLDWKLTELDKRSLRVSMLALAQELGRLGVARMKLEDWLAAKDDQWSSRLVGGNHHMGTTRMSKDASTGVVDENCRVHGVGNLWIAGSSVFPTSGHANPTLTLLALALRLSDHLKSDPQAPSA